MLTQFGLPVAQKLAHRVLPPTGPGIAVQLPDFGLSACLLRKVGREAVAHA